MRFECLLVEPLCLRHQNDERIFDALVGRHLAGHALLGACAVSRQFGVCRQRLRRTSLQLAVITTNVSLMVFWLPCADP